MIFGYTRFLEDQVSRLYDRIDKLEQRNQELILALAKLRPIPTVTPKAPPKHEMTKTETTAKCSCGWNVAISDPILLQQEISKHYRVNVIPGGRSRGWVDARARLEAAAEKDTGEKDHGTV